MSARNPKHENKFLDTNTVLEPLVIKACGREYLAVDENDNMVYYSFREKNGKISCYINNEKVLDLKEKLKFGDSPSIN